MHIPERSESSSLINIIYIVCLRVTLYTCIYVYVQVLTLEYYSLEKSKFLKLTSQNNYMLICLLELRLLRF